MVNKLTTHEFISRAAEIHNNYYDYSKTNYINAKTKVIIIDPIYGEFEATPDNHLRNKSGHPMGKSKKISSTRSFDNDILISILKSNYPPYITFEKVKIQKIADKIILTDSDFGDYVVRASYAKKKLTFHPERLKYNKIVDNHTNNIENFINESRNLFGDRFLYTKVFYKNVDTPVCLIDKEYGEFYITPWFHIKLKMGHPKYQKKKFKDIRLKNSKEHFIKSSITKYGNIHDFSNFVYKYNEKIEMYDIEYGKYLVFPHWHLYYNGIHPKRRYFQKEHIDHIIPLSIICSYNDRINSIIVQNRPLFLLLDSEINKQIISCSENLSKSDWINCSLGYISARTVRNNYNIIRELLCNLGLSLDDIDHIIQEDINYINQLLGDTRFTCV